MPARPKPIKQTSARDSWRTPQWFFDMLHKGYKFKMDLAASEENALLPKYFSVENSALENRWPKGTSFCNPPYSQCAEFAEYAAKQSGKGRNSVLLLPANRTEQAWFHDWVLPYSTIVFIRKRLKFEPADPSLKVSSPTFGSLLACFSSDLEGGTTRFFHEGEHIASALEVSWSALSSISCES